MVKVILKKGRDESLKRFHPWVFSGAVQTVEGSPREGDTVKVYSREGEFLGTGHYQIGSIAVRLLSFEDISIDEGFWLSSLGKAYGLRKSLGLAGAEHTTAYRLVHGEGDFLPGLIVDIYGDTAVMQAHSAGMFLAGRASPPWTQHFPR